MKKLMSLVMVAAMLSNTAFATSTVDHTQMIAKAFDQFRYSMTVSTDASNASFQDQATESFKASMEELQSNGVSAAEIMAYMRGNILDSATRADFDTLLNSMSANISSEDAGNLAMQFMANRYQQGASYSGGGTAHYKIAAIIVGVVIVGVVTYIIIGHKKPGNGTTTSTNTSTGTNTNTSTGTNTNTNTNTNYGGCYNYDTQTYYQCE